MIIEKKLKVRWLGEGYDYYSCWQSMQNFTCNRQYHTIDEIWLLEHSPIFTQGQNGKSKHLLIQKNIPIMQTDRGGQITYHGPGQLIAYMLIDLKRKKINIREFVNRLEQSVVELLAQYNIVAFSKQDAPGVYI